jgi:hypothetical protein
MKRDIGLIILVVIGAFAFAALLEGCSTPVSFTAGGPFGLSATVSFPDGIRPVPVSPTTEVSTPTLLVPSGNSAAGTSVPVTTSVGTTTVVPAVEAPVTAPILAVPAK